VPSAEILIRALEHVSSSIDSETRLHDQIVVRLNRVYDVSLRRIADHTKVGYGTVANIVHRTEAASELILPAQYEILTPIEMVAHLCATYAEHEPVKPDEIAYMREEHESVDPGPTPPPNWQWIHMDLSTMLTHAACDRASLVPAEVAARYIQAQWPGRWRINHLGTDIHAELRANWLDFLGRLTRHSCATC
jgi:hypothetical protein